MKVLESPGYLAQEYSAIRIPLACTSGCNSKCRGLLLWMTLDWKISSLYLAYWQL